MSSVSFVVRGLLARHLDRAPSTVHAWHSLERDLDITPLELVLVAVEIEALEGVELDVEGLSAAQTVSDLYAYFRRAMGRARRERGRVSRVA
jgi:hypothetical protein